MTSSLKKYCKILTDLTEDELLLIDKYFMPQTIERKKYLLEEGEICRFIAFIVKGSVRHFHIKDGEEKTCDISLENSFITEFSSFTYEVPSNINFQALENSELLVISKQNLFKLYDECRKYETVGRLMAEKVAFRATEIAMSLSSDKPETRYKNLLAHQPELFQRVRQKYIANFLGITPESLSRIRKRIYTKHSSA